MCNSASETMGSKNLQVALSIALLKKLNLWYYTLLIFILKQKMNLIFRFLKIFVTFIRFGVFGILRCPEKSNGKKLAAAFESLGSVFVKIGQILSSRNDFLGENIARELSYLQDKVAYFSFEEVKQIIKKELGYEINELYLEFSEKPVAAASIAQVHKAITHEGKEVAVKVLRPGIEEQFDLDISGFILLARIVEFFSKRARRLKPVAVFERIRKSVKFEMDLRFEAAGASEMLENFLHSNDVIIPEVDWKRTSQRVLTIGWVDGISIYETDKIIEAGFDLKEVAAKLAVMFFNQAYKYGFFHADLHPGNIFLTSDGKVALVDFGILGRLDKETRLYVARILRGFIRKDYMEISQIHFDAGYIAQDQCPYQFAQGLRAIGEPIVGLPVNEISIGKLLAQLFKLTEDFNMNIQPQLLLLQKTTILVEAIGYKLDKSVNLWKLAEPWIEDWAIENLGIEARVKDVAIAIAKKIAKMSAY